MGAIASGNIRVLNQDIIESFGISDEKIECTAAAEDRELGGQFNSRLSPLGYSGFFPIVCSVTRNMSMKPIRRKRTITLMPNRWLPDQ